MGSQQYLFVNVTQDKRPEDRKTAKEIRTHVMQDIGKARRKPRKNMKFPLKLRSPPPPLAQSRLDVTSVVKSGEDLEVEPHTPERSVAVGFSHPFWDQNPLQILDDSWGMDPFALYTIALALNGNTESQSRILKSTFWRKTPKYFFFPFAPANSQAFRDLLISPTMRDAVVHDFGKGMSICLRRYAVGLRCINSSIASKGLQTISETHVIKAIVGFICYNYACHDFAQAELHFTGLRGIIDLGGGTGSLPAQVRLMIMWIDITIALMRNHPPHYALPADLLPILLPPPLESSQQIENMTALMLSISPEMSSLVDVYRDLKKLAAWLDTQSVMPGIERDSLSVCLFLDPTAHRALSDSAPMMPMISHPLAKACALAALMVIISVRRKYDSFPGVLPSYAATITNALENAEMHSPKYLPLRLWLLAVAGITTTEWNELQSVQVRLVAEIRAAGLRNWRDVTERISFMPWFERLWEEECTLLGEDVMSKLHLSETDACGISCRIE
ncbi:hypothetical protein F5Y01DRAFT_212663 [Xylaria sp. FL0043]|nr:hypothetical protein F5Y01DRAFT_212663 [Xylaria sp. FL0043]